MKIQRDLLSVENLVKSLKSFSKNVHKELFKKMKKHSVINEEIKRKVNEFVLISNSVDIRNHSMETLEELCRCLQKNSDSLYREIIEVKSEIEIGFKMNFVF